MYDGFVTFSHTHARTRTLSLFLQRASHPPTEHDFSEIREYSIICEKMKVEERREREKEEEEEAGETEKKRK